MQGGRGQRRHQRRIGVLVLVIDADTVLEADALSRAVLPFLEDPVTVAVGGTSRSPTAATSSTAASSTSRLPRSWFARFQVVEYMRSFLLFRLACASQNAVVIISGAFGLFRRDAMIAVGGYDRTAIGEDMDLTIRLQRTSARAASRSGSHSTPTRSPGRRRPKTGSRCGHSVTAGAAACSRRSGDIAG